MQRDRVHGSSWYYDQALRYISGSKMTELRRKLSKVKKIRPGMGTLLNIASYLDDSVDEIDLEDRIKFLGRYKEIVTDQLIKNFPKQQFSSILTISNSSAVLSYIRSRHPETVYLMESKPGSEYKIAYQKYSEFSEVRIIPDTTACFYIKQGIPVFTGSDGIYGGGFFVNKVGTSQLLACARLLGTQTYVLAESYKASVVETIENVEITSSSNAGCLKDSVFEKVSIDWVDYLVTDCGIFHRPDHKALLSMVEKFEHYMKTNFK